MYLPGDQVRATGRLLQGGEGRCDRALHPTGSPVDDLDYADLYAWRHAVLRALEGAGGPEARTP